MPQATIAAALVAIWAVGLTGGCVGERDDALSPEQAAYLDSPEARRAALERSLVDQANTYSQRRLGSYGLTEADGATPAGWDALPVFNPPVRLLMARETAAFAGNPRAVSEGDFEPFAPLVEVADDHRWTRAELVELGRLAFERFPVRVDNDVGAATATLDEAASVGLLQDDGGGLGGLVRVQLPAAAEGFGVTCATCHTAVSSTGERTPGLANAAFDRGAIAATALAKSAAPPVMLAELRAWGPGRVDVTPDDIDNPTSIPDLRPLRHQSHLHAAATVANDLIALAVRVETLLITSLDEAARPPRAVSLGIAMYLWSLGAGKGTPSVTSSDTDGDAGGAGAALFDANCSACHRADGTVGAPVALEIVGTDPAVGTSPARTTGTWRVPSLWGAADRPRLLHTATVTSFADLLDPERQASADALRRGHAFGSALTEEERTSVALWLTSGFTAR